MQRNIDACIELASQIRSSFGPNGIFLESFESTGVSKYVIGSEPVICELPFILQE